MDYLCRNKIRAIGCLLALHFGLVAWSGYVHSPNANEPAHLVAGVSHWELQRFELYRVNPPLVRLVAAIPAVILGVDTDWADFSDGPTDRPVFHMGTTFSQINGLRTFWLVTLGRWMCLPFTVLGALACYAWAEELYGKPSGLLALALWCFSPMVLGHAAFLTPDSASAACCVAASYAYWRWLRQATWARAGLAGMLLGFALLTKLTLVILIVLWPIMFVMCQLRDRRQFLSKLLQLTMTMLIALHILNSAYLYDGLFRQLGSYEFSSRMLSGQDDDEVGNRFANTPLAAVPVPLPEQYLFGVDVQKSDFERDRITYFRGKLYDHGFWYYYLYCLLVKLPVGTWLLSVLAAISVLKRRSAIVWRDELSAFLPGIVIFGLVSSETDYNAHLRYILPAFPFGFLWCSRAARGVWTESSGAVVGDGGVFCRRIVIAATIAMIVSSLWQFPHSMAYFNEPSGGPMNGDAHLFNSNLDWGQELSYLQEWVEKHPDAQPLHVAYYGLTDPSVCGFDFTLPARATEQDESLRPGWYAISINFLRGHEYSAYTPDGESHFISEDDYGQFLKRTPTFTVGRSIRIYELREEDISRLTADSQSPVQ